MKKLTKLSPVIGNCSLAERQAVKLWVAVSGLTPINLSLIQLSIASQLIVRSIRLSFRCCARRPPSLVALERVGRSQESNLYPNKFYPSTKRDRSEGLKSCVPNFLSSSLPCLSINSNLRLVFPNSVNSHLTLLVSSMALWLRKSPI